MPDEDEKTPPWFRRYYGIRVVSALTVLGFGVVFAVTHIPGLSTRKDNVEFFFGLGCVVVGGIGLLVIGLTSRRKL